MKPTYRLLNANSFTLYLNAPPLDFHPLKESPNERNWVRRLCVHRRIDAALQRILDICMMTAKVSRVWIFHTTQ